MTSDDLSKRVSAATAFIRAGFEPQASLAAVGLGSVAHTGLMPVTVKEPDDPHGGEEEL